MNRIFSAIAVAAAICLAHAAYADLRQYSQDLLKKETETDPDHSVRRPIQTMLQASCNINDALRAGISGESQSFSDSLEDAEKKLLLGAGTLRSILEKNTFTKNNPKTPLRLNVGRGEIIEIRSGTDIVRAIALLAQRSADAIDRIRTGKAGDEDFAEIIRNTALITQLITDFYGIRTS